MDIPELSVYLAEPVNIVEIYWLPQRRPEVQSDTLYVDVGWPCAPTASLARFFGNGTSQRYREYTHRDVTYSYDLANDAQRAYQRATAQDHLMDRAYVLALHEEPVPPHRFPCVKEIQESTDVTRTTYRINNRMYVTHDTVAPAEGAAGRAPAAPAEYVYVRYNHAANVDLARMQQDLQRTLGILKRVVPSGAD